MKLQVSAANRIALALVLGMVVFVGGAAAYIASIHAWAGARLAELEPRYARLVGVGESGAALDAALLERKVFLARRVYPSSQDIARAGSDALQRAREMFSKSGLIVSSSQVLAAKEVDGFDRIPLVFRLDGDLAALQAALVVLPTHTPSLFVDGFSVQVQGMPQAALPQQLSIQINLFVLRNRQ